MLALGGAELVPQLAERRRERARHLRLREAELEGDPLLAPVPVVAEDDHAALAAAEGADAGVQEQPLLASLELGSGRRVLEGGLVERYDDRRRGGPAPRADDGRATTAPRPIAAARRRSSGPRTRPDLRRAPRRSRRPP